jgi:DNA-directed RNA polymerase specialized sigma24 family protein
MNAWTATQQPRTLRQQADQTVDEHYRSLEGEVLGKVARKLSARSIDLDHTDLEEAYCQAWHGVWEQINGGAKIASLTAMLVEITWRRAVSMYRELHLGQRANVDVDSHGVEDDLDKRLDDAAKLQRLIQRLTHRLNQQERQVVSLCLIHGYTRPEARQLLGIKDEARMQKLMDRATKKIGGVVAALDARGCGGEEWASMLRAYALGLIAEDETDYRRASAHIEECASCRRYVVGLRRVAAIVPPLVPPPLHRASALSQLQRFFTDLVGSGPAAPTTTAAASSAGAAGGGATVMGTLGSVKVAAVIVVAAATGATAAIHATDSQAPTRRPAAHVANTRTSSGDLGASASAASTTVVTGASGRSPVAARRATTATGSQSIAVAKEFGIEGQHASGSTSSSPPRATASASFDARREHFQSATSESSSNTAANVKAVQREFGPER